MQFGFERNWHELIHGAHHDGAKPTEHEQVSDGDDVLVIVIRGEDGGIADQPADAKDQRQQAGEDESQRQFDRGGLEGDCVHCL